MSRKIVDPVEYETKVSPINKAYVRDFIVECKSKGIRPKTIIQYNADLRIILTYIYRLYDNKRLIDMKRKEIRDFSIMLQDRGLSPARVNRLLSSFRCCLEYLADDEDVDYEWSRGAKVKGPKNKRVRPLTYLRDDQVDWVKNRLLQEGNLLQAVYFMMSYISSNRKGEVYQVKKDGLLSNFQSNTVEGKGGKEFEVVYDQQTRELIQQYLKERGPDDIPELFVKCYKNGKKRVVHPSTFNEWTTRMSKLLSEYEGEPVYFRPHDLRSSRLTSLRDQGVPIEKL
jgi:integrase/recombinase XerD